MSGVHIVELGKLRFVSGLFWQTLTEPRQAAAEARRVGKSMNFDLCVLKKRPVPQAGYGAREDGAERGMLSLAAAIEQGVREAGISGNWLGAFRLENDAYAYVAVRDDAILPESDFAGSDDAVRGRMEQDFGIGGWDIVFAPASWGFSSSEERSAAQFLPSSGGRIRVQKAWALEPLERKAPIVQVTAALGAAALATGGLAYWKHVKDEQARAAAGATRTALSSSRPNSTAAQAGPPPWVASPRPREFISGCMRGIGGRLYGSGGWKLSNVNCTASGLHFAWERSRSTIPSLKRAVPDARVDMTGEKAELTRPLPGMNPAGDERLLADQEAVAALASPFQASGIEIHISGSTTPLRLPGAEQKQAAQDWKAMRFSITSKLDPLSLAPFLDVPGARITRISATGTSSIDWNVEGDLYAR